MPSTYLDAVGMRQGPSTSDAMKERGLPVKVTPGVVPDVKLCRASATRVAWYQRSSKTVIGVDLDDGHLWNTLLSAVDQVRPLDERYLRPRDEGLTGERCRRWGLVGVCIRAQRSWPRSARTGILDAGRLLCSQAGRVQVTA